MRFHKGRRSQAGNIEIFANEKQDAISKTLKAYTLGLVNANTLRSQLRENQVQIDPQLDKLIRKHESGDFVSYVDLGKQVYRQLNG
jgi:hypothetical protein